MTPQGPYTASDAAQALGVTETQLKRLVDAGKIARPEGIPRGYYTRESVDAYKLARDSRRKG